MYNECNSIISTLLKISHVRKFNFATSTSKSSEKATTIKGLPETMLRADDNWLSHGKASKNVSNV